MPHYARSHVDDATWDLHVIITALERLMHIDKGQSYEEVYRFFVNRYLYFREQGVLPYDHERHDLEELELERDRGAGDT